MTEPISFADLPDDILFEIRKRLDATSFNLCRIAYPTVARRFQHHRSKFNWMKMFKNFVLFRWYDDLINHKTYLDCLHQAVFDDHQIAFNYHFGKIVSVINDIVDITHPSFSPSYYMDDVKRSLSYAALMGGAAVCWDALGTGNCFHEIDNPVMIASGNNQQLFVQNKLKIDLVSCLKQLYNDKPKEWKPRFELPRKPAVVEMVRRHHWSQVDWFIDGVIAQGWELDCHIIKLVLMNCVAYGNIDVLERFANLCDKNMLVYGVGNGVTDKGIKWLEEKFPKFLTYFKNERNCKKAVKCAAKRGSPKVLQWLFDKDYANINRDGNTIVDQIRKKNYIRTRNWFRRFLMDEGTAISQKLLLNAVFV